MKRKPRIPYAVRDWLLALIFAGTVTGMGRMGWYLAHVVKGDPLNDFAFAYFAGPALVVMLALFGDTWSGGYPGHRQQLWASMLMGLSAAVAFEIQLALPGWWPVVLALPTAWWFTRFYHVKRDRPGAIEAFETNRTVLAIQRAYEGFLDRVYEPGWRDRKDEWFSQDEMQLRKEPGLITKALAVKRAKGGPDRRISQEDIDEVLQREFREWEAARSAFAPKPPHGGGKMHDPSSP